MATTDSAPAAPRTRVAWRGAGGAAAARVLAAGLRSCGARVGRGDGDGDEDGGDMSACDMLAVLLADDAVVADTGGGAAAKAEDGIEAEALRRGVPVLAVRLCAQEKVAEAGPEPLPAQLTAQGLVRVGVDSLEQEDAVRAVWEKVRTLPHRLDAAQAGVWDLRVAPSMLLEHTHGVLSCCEEPSDCAAARRVVAAVEGKVNALGKDKVCARDCVAAWRELGARDPAAANVLGVALVGAICRAAWASDKALDGRSLVPLLRCHVARAWCAAGEGGGAGGGQDDELPLRPRLTRSAQGFCVVPLLNLLDANGNIEELIRLHVWPLEEAKQANCFGVHAHQPEAQSHVLHGAVLNTNYEVKACEGSEPAPSGGWAAQAVYRLRWDGSTKYDPKHRCSVASNTGERVWVRATCCGEYLPGDVYKVPAGNFHTTQIAHRKPAVTLFHFSGNVRFEADAGVLGPVDGEVLEKRTPPLEDELFARAHQVLRESGILLDGDSDADLNFQP